MDLLGGERDSDERSNTQRRKNLQGNVMMMMKVVILSSWLTIQDTRSDPRRQMTLIQYEESEQLGRSSARRRTSLEDRYT